MGVVVHGEARVSERTWNTAEEAKVAWVVIGCM